MLTHDYTQTLTTMNLYLTELGDEGVQYLADALQRNKVMLSPSSYFIHSSVYVDTHYIDPPLQ